MIGRRDIGLLGTAASLGATVIVAPAQAQTGTEGSTWEAIRTRKVLRLGATSSEPWYAKSAATGEWSGMAVALAQQIASDLDAKLEVVETTWANAPAGLQARQFDVMFVLDPTPPRALAIDFPFAPVLYYALGVMSRDPIPVSTWIDLDKPGMTIAVPIGTSMDRELTARLPHADITRLRNNDETILHYQSGRSRLLALFHPALLAYRLRIGQGTVIVPKPAVSAVAGAGVRREADKTWRDYLTTVLTYHYEAGTTDRLYREYLASRGMDPASVPGITKAALAG